MEMNVANQNLRLRHLFKFTSENWIDGNRDGHLGNIVTTCHVQIEGQAIMRKI